MRRARGWGNEEGRQRVEGGEGRGGGGGRGGEWRVGQSSIMKLSPKEVRRRDGEKEPWVLSLLHQNLRDASPACFCLPPSPPSPSPPPPVSYPPSPEAICHVSRHFWRNCWIRDEPAWSRGKMISNLKLKTFYFLKTIWDPDRSAAWQI